MTYRDDLEAAHARIAALEAELAHVRDEELGVAQRDTARVQAELGRELEAARSEVAQLREQLARTRAECESYVERIRILQDERARRAQAPAAGKPIVLDRGAAPVCPHCKKLGRAVTLLRDAELTPGVCPQCASISLLR